MFGEYTCKCVHLWDRFLGQFAMNTQTLGCHAYKAKHCAMNLQFIEGLINHVLVSSQTKYLVCVLWHHQ